MGTAAATVASSGLTVDDCENDCSTHDSSCFGPPSACHATRVPLAAMQVLALAFAKVHLCLCVSQDKVRHLTVAADPTSLDVFAFRPKPWIKRHDREKEEIEGVHERLFA